MGEPPSSGRDPQRQSVWYLQDLGPFRPLLFRLCRRFCSLQTLVGGRCGDFRRPQCSKTAFSPLHERCRCACCVCPPFAPCSLQPATLQHTACCLQPWILLPCICRCACCACSLLSPCSLQPAACSLAAHNLLPATLDPAACSLARGRPEAFKSIRNPPIARTCFL